MTQTISFTVNMVFTKALGLIEENSALLLVRGGRLGGEAVGPRCRQRQSQTLLSDQSNQSDQSYCPSIDALSPCNVQFKVEEL